MGLGLEGGFGAGGAADALKEILRERFLRAKEAQDSKRQDTELQLRQRSLDQNDQYRQDSLAENARFHDQSNADRLFKENMTLNEAIPPGTELPATSPIVGRLTPMGGVAPRGIDLPTPPSLAADPNASPEMPGTVANSPSLSGRLFVKQATQKQKDTEADNARQLEQVRRAKPPAPVHDTARGLMRPNDAGVMEPVLDAGGKTVQGYHPPPAAQDKLTKVEHKGDDGRTVIEWLPQSELKGKTFQKGVSSTTDSRLASAEAVNQTGNDIIAKLSDPAYTAKLGPAMGRYSKLQDFIGNPPPEFSELAGAIESYSLANMGVHGMRSAQGAQLIAKLLNQPHTPESMVASIKGLNKFSEHFMQNEGRVMKSSTEPATATPASAPKRIVYGMDGKPITP